MEVEQRVQKLKLRIIQEIETSSKKGNSASILANSKLLSECESISDSILESYKRLNQLEDSLNTGNYLDQDKQDTKEVHFRSKSMEKAISQRLQLIEELKSKGQVFSREGRSKAVYRNENGDMLGAPFATKRKGRWFLGVPILEYYCVVVILEISDDKYVRFFFPKDLITDLESKFSRSKRGDQYKLNISKRGDKYLLNLNEVDPLDITEYVDNFDGLM